MKDSIRQCQDDIETKHIMDSNKTSMKKKMEIENLTITQVVTKRKRNNR